MAFLCVEMTVARGVAAGVVIDDAAPVPRSLICRSCGAVDFHSSPLTSPYSFLSWSSSSSIATTFTGSVPVASAAWISAALASIASRIKFSWTRVLTSYFAYSAHSRHTFFGETPTRAWAGTSPRCVIPCLSIQLTGWPCSELIHRWTLMVVPPRGPPMQTSHTAQPQ
jgi:hypothetical protein